jgi:hypothetical protein
VRFAAHTKRPASNALVAVLSAATNYINLSTLAGTLGVYSLSAQIGVPLSETNRTCCAPSQLFRF